MLAVIAGLAASRDSHMDIKTKLPAYTTKCNYTAGLQTKTTTYHQSAIPTPQGDHGDTTPGDVYKGSEKSAPEGG